MSDQETISPPPIRPSAAAALLDCPKCRTSVEVSFSEIVEQQCPVCLIRLERHVYPRLFHEPESNAGSQGMVSVSGDATCHFYPELKAELVCDECGCLMSRKASVDWGGRDLCMPCLHNLRENKQSADFQAKTKLYDNRALALVTWLAPVSLFTAPIAFFLLLKNRKANRGFVPRGPFRWWLALLLSIAWMALWGFLLVTWISLLVREIQS